MVDKRGDVVGLSVERAMGIQDRPPSAEPTLKPKFASRRFGSLEKSKDRSNVSLASASGEGVSVGISCAKTNWGRRVRFTREADNV